MMVTTPSVQVSDDDALEWCLGSALVLFNMYYIALQGQTSILQPGNVVLYFLKVIFVSPIVGALMGLLSVAGISYANRRSGEDDRTIQMSITLCCAYISFFIAEYIIGVSGVICCCTAGFVISLLGMPLILEQSTMHTVWSAIEWVGNTLLFLLAGLIIGTHALAYSRIVDFAYIVVVYIYIMVVRIVMVVGFYPLLSNFGQKINYREAIFVSFAGLRGGVALALALLLENSAVTGFINVSAEDGHKVAFLVGGVTTLTLIINAVLASPLLRYLKLVTSKTDDQIIYLHYVRKRLRIKCVLVLSKLVRARPDIDYETVKRYCSILEGVPRPGFTSVIV